MQTLDNTQAVINVSALSCLQVIKLQVHTDSQAYKQRLVFT